MEKNIKEVKEIKEEKVYKININYINFIEKVIKEKIMSKENLKKEYIEIVKLRVNNIKRVDKRNKRKELNKNLILLLKERNIDLKDYNKESEKVIGILSEKKNCNYLEIKV